MDCILIKLQLQVIYRHNPVIYKVCTCTCVHVYVHVVVIVDHML